MLLQIFLMSMAPAFTSVAIASPAIELRGQELKKAELPEAESPNLASNSSTGNPAGGYSASSYPAGNPAGSYPAGNPVVSYPAGSYAGGYKDTLPDMVEQISPGVVNISSTTVFNYQVYGMDDFLRLWGIPQEKKQTSLGSGFIIDKDGSLLTNNHVVEQASEVLVTLFDKRKFKARIVGKDEKMDLALLQIQSEDGKVPPDLKPVPLGDSDRVRIAESVVAIGNPFGLQNTVTKGIVSAKDRTIGLGPFDKFIQTDASINPGNSGGPLFNVKGEVIAINSAIHSQTGQSSGLGFAIPINEAKALLGDLKRYGHVPRPWLGIFAEKVSSQLQEYYDLATSQGVLVYNLINGAPGHKAGLRQGDIIVQMDGTATLEPNDLERILAKRRPKDPIQVKILRGERKRELTVKLEELPRHSQLPRGTI